MKQPFRLPLWLPLLAVACRDPPAPPSSLKVPAIQSVEFRHTPDGSTTFSVKFFPRDGEPPVQ